MKKAFIPIFSLFFILLISVPAQAYIGPGAGVSVLGSVLGILVTILIAIGAIVFWPIRKMMKRRKTRSESNTEASANTNPGTRATGEASELSSAESDDPHDPV